MCDETNIEAIRKKAALEIDPRTAETEWWYAYTIDPYGVCSELPDECRCVGREYFARSPGSEVWVSFRDLPDATRDALWEKHKTKLGFPAGLNGLAGKRREISTRRKDIDNGNPEVFAEYLRSAKPRLICRVEVNGPNIDSRLLLVR
jgi:hypothetical protein